MSAIDFYKKEFCKLLNLRDFSISEKLEISCTELFNKACSDKEISISSDSVIFSIKKKLKLEENNVKSIIDRCAKNKIYFNSIEKRKLLDFYCRTDIESAISLAFEKGFTEASLFFESNKPLTAIETINKFHQECDNPINKRTKSVDLSLKQPMLEAIFSCFVYENIGEKFIHSFNSNFSGTEYIEDYWDFIHQDKDFQRNHALTYIDLENLISSHHSYEATRNYVCGLINSCYINQNNHTYTFIKIPKNLSNKWNLLSDLIIYAEKFIEEEEKVGYFNSYKLTQLMNKHINFDNDKLFNKVNKGYFYKDTFILFEDNGQSEPDLLLVLRKDERDETKLPCPTCRSLNVQGNSYPSLGIKSWECKNPICSDRSMSNRGRRYSFESIMKQHSIDCENAQIPKELLARWKRDVVYNYSSGEELEYILRCYSLPNDTVYLTNLSEGTYLNRNLRKFENQFVLSKHDYWGEFAKLDFFKRWNDTTPVHNNNSKFSKNNVIINETTKILVGDCEDSLQSLKENSIDMAVTSPPYYNAREYSQYDNIYLYIIKMTSIASNVYRTLRPGAIFLFNIFDYFDNENIVALSAMGKKRLILTSYIKIAFENIGLVYINNIPWDKGEIEGKRAYNSGNNSPYYQSPLNCWEHMMVFKKPGRDVDVNLPVILKCKPVHKMVKGVNTFGHTAPFPVEIPRLLTSNMKKGQVILDPFAGSGTTGVAAKLDGIESILCEAMPEYVELIQKRLS
ncbi:DNA-methyltransferase [Vibrio alginolyticus]|uniref:DNA-methyltransferase n=1 Tax=Vibrio alginolyticus TaxID=663 RepID=UPI001303944D|nr:site-specific DNA-methyltransferase [Vibrio alginolyticus]MBS9920015.1 site-specific DNA-methyltransferase [Vibrio alginolyticus]